MSDTTAANLDIFWELVDEVLNAVLFVIIGLEVLVLTFTGTYLIAGFIAIPLVLAARFIAVALPITALGHRADYPPNTIRILTWGGLRGGISVALALSIPAEFDGLPIPEREVIIVLTYIVVVFSILVQGLTLGPLVRRWGAAGVAPD
jgi:CPA1 family monovalent cation:H+ antiporter